MRTSPFFRYCWSLTLLSVTVFTHAQNVGINTTGAAPNGFALLDVDNEGILRGVLLARLPTIDRESIAGLGITEDGLTVYDTTTKTYWYWDGTQWVEIGAAVANSGWGLNGNAGTVDGVHFLGTTDNVPITVRVNGQQAARIDHLTGNAYWGFRAGSTNSGTQNTATGQWALSSNTTGVENSAHGNGALRANTTGFWNSALGANSLGSNTQGNLNTAAGYSAMTSNTTGQDNCALGGWALMSNTTGSLNVAIGLGALGGNTVGHRNTATGHLALSDNTSGIANTAVGHHALASNQTGSENTALGEESLFSNRTASGNTALGSQVLFSNVAGSNATAIGQGALQYANSTTVPFVNTNVAVGYSALRGSATPANNTGLNNTAVGYQALVNSTSGYDNVAVGSHAMDMNTTGWWCTGIGSYSLTNNLTGEGNTATGCLSLNSNSTGNGNSAFGFQALGTNSMGSYNTAIGRVALSANEFGWNNVGVGVGADCWNQSGSNNTIVGASAGRGDVAHSKSGCVFLGYSAGYNELSSDRLYIENSASSDPLIYGEFDNDFVRINHNLGVGCSAFGGGTKVLALENGTPPSAPISGVLLYSTGASSELEVMDEAGFTTVLSPHNFSLTPKSEPMAWSFYSKNANLGLQVNVDMMHVARLVEELSGAQLVHLADLDGNDVGRIPQKEKTLIERVAALERSLTLAHEHIALLQQALATQQSPLIELE